MKYIYHHLGLGDHIICNGMVRHFCKRNDNIVLFCYSHYRENVEYMYRDLSNLEIFDFATEPEIVNFIHRNNLQDNLIKTGFDRLKLYLNRMTFDEAFYAMIDLNFDIRFDEFYFERDYETENKVCEKLNPNNEKYIFVLDDPNRGFSIDMNKVTSEYKVIRNDFEFKMFDYIRLLENAEELHMMQTGFLDLVNSYKMKKPKIYRHNYVRKYPKSIHSKGINNINDVD